MGGIGAMAAAEGHLAHGSAPRGPTEGIEGDALAFWGGQLISVDVTSAGLRLAKTDGITITLEDGAVLRSPDVHLVLRAIAAQRRTFAAQGRITGPGAEPSPEAYTRR